MSKIELMGAPKNAMKRPRSSGFQRCGSLRNSLPTLSNAIAQHPAHAVDAGLERRDAFGERGDALRQRAEAGGRAGKRHHRHGRAAHTFCPGTGCRIPGRGNVSAFPDANSSIGIDSPVSADWLTNRSFADLPLYEPIMHARHETSPRQAKAQDGQPVAALAEDDVGCYQRSAAVCTRASQSDASSSSSRVMVSDAPAISSEVV